MNPLKQKEITDEMVAAIQKQTTVEAGVSVLAHSINAQIKQVLTGVILPAPIKEQVECVFEAIEESKAKIAAVLLANTPNVHLAPVEIDERFSAETISPQEMDRVEAEHPPEENVAPDGGQGEAVRVAS